MTLYELNHAIRGVVEECMESEYWVQGELSEGKVGYGNHFYGEMIQKDEQGVRIIAKARLTCWDNTYRMVALRFRHVTGESLRAGMNVMLLVRVTFHEQYGLSLNILDIEPSFTLGEMALRRKRILQQLEEDGTIHDNQTLPFPILPQRIAVISSATAAGYEDFCNQIQHNEYGFHFVLQLFPAVMQGAHVEESVIAALEAIQQEATQWDVIVIIRGGGATSDLSDFDSYPLASCITQSQLPVITGIGHERDETVLDYVAHTHLKTPTAVAAFLISQMTETATRLEMLRNTFVQHTTHRITYEKQRMERLSIMLPMVFGTFRTRNEHRLELLWNDITHRSRNRIEHERHILQMLEQRTKQLDPALLLKRGYSITTCNGQLVRDISALHTGDQLTTHVGNGIIYSHIDNLEQCKKD